MTVLGTTFTFIYAEDETYIPSDQVLNTLRARGDLASFLGFPPDPLFMPEAELRLMQGFYYGEGMDDRDPVERPFAILITNALRFESLLQGERIYTSEVDAKRMFELEQILGTRLKQDTYLR